MKMGPNIIPLFSEPKLKLPSMSSNIWSWESIPVTILGLGLKWIHYGPSEEGTSVRFVIL